MNGYGRGEDNQAKGAKSVVTRETFGMTLLLFSVVLLVFSIVGPYLLGEIGVAINAFLLGTFGYFVYPFLLLTVYLSLVMITGKRFVAPKWVLLTLGIICSCFLIAHLSGDARFFGSGFGAYMGGCWRAAETTAATSTAGGVIFGLIAYPLRAILSTVGAYVLASLLLALFVFLFLAATPLKDRIKRSRGRAKKQKEQEELSFDDLPSRRTMQSGARPAEQPRYQQPEQPRYQQPEQPRYQQPEQPRYQQPEQPRYQQPEQPRYQQPEQPRYQQPEQPRYQQPEQPRYQQPEPPRYQQPGQPRYEQPKYNQSIYERSNPGRTDRPSDITGLFDNTPKREPTGMDILYGDPARDYTSNLIFRDDSYFNRRRRSSVAPEPPAEPPKYDYPVSFGGYEPPRTERPKQTYNSAFEKQAETPRPAMPRKVVEQKPELRGSGYTLRSENLNYPQMPSFKAPQVPPEEEEVRDFYAKDVPYEEEFSSAPNVNDLPEPPAEPEPPASPRANALRRAPASPAPEPVKSEPRPFPPAEPEPPAPESEQDDPDARQRQYRNLFSRPSSDRGFGIDFGDPGALEDRVGNIRDRNDRFTREDPQDRFTREEPQDRFTREDPQDRFTREDPQDRFTREDPQDRFTRDEPQDRFTRDEPQDRFEENERGSRAIEGLRSNADLFEDDEPMTDELFGEADEEPPVRAGRGRETVHEIPSGPAPMPQRHVYKPYRCPSEELFREYDDTVSVPQEEIDRNCQIIVDTLAGFRVDAEIMRVTAGPSVTRYDIDIPRNITVGTVTKRDAEIAMRLHARDGVNMYSNNETGFVAIEVPNNVRAIVGLRSVMQSEQFQKSKPGSLMFAIGKDIEGRNIIGNIAKMKHLLVAGATGSGKSVCLNAMLISLICKYSPEELRLILIDPKKVEFTVYDGLPHLMINEIIADAQKAIMALNWAIKEMERRYELFEQKTKRGTVVRDLDEYNTSLDEDEQKLPKIVIVVDELADLMSVAKKDIEERIQRLTQKARAAGIHLVLATQRPSVNVITGVIKGNLPTRIAFRVIQEVDSRTILDESGAEKLLGNGDMLYKTEGMFNCTRVQGAFLSSQEVQAVIEDIKANNEAFFDQDVAEYINNSDPESSSGGSDAAEGGGDNVDGLYVKALGKCVQLGQASISLIQRKCAVGYNHAGKIIEWMELMGYVSPFDGKAKARTVLLTKEEYESKYGPLE